ncbi:ribosomal protein S18-alanine N-acetyltransferase [Nakamurella sp. A5-74]|uniref:Ribosomal protein S18-alanine N-acetyltransferase n=1 Tax=Nakamurella sp. A5-74 TaxID=3158264 RepID=A0AAU8DUD3_9ACTN
MTSASVLRPPWRPLEPLRWWDIEAVADLETVLFPGDSPWTAGMFWSELAMGHHYVVVRDSGPPPHPDRPHPDRPRVVGYAGLAVHGLDHPDEEAEVQTIGVHPDLQGQGLGARLLDDLLAVAGRRRVLLEVRVDNDPARRLYERRGFARIGLRRGYYRPSNADALVMQRVGS